ncbi:MAG: hypothetical protein ACLGI5_03415 [Thermoleophilia bacterium]
MKMSTGFVRAAAGGLVARSFVVVTVIWWVVLIVGPIAMCVAAGMQRLAVVLGLFYGVVLSAGRRAAPMLLGHESQERASAELTRGDQPLLWREVDEAASAVGAGELERMSLTLEPAIEAGRGWLRVGLPLVAMLSIEELRVLLRHRLAAVAADRGGLAAALAPVEVAVGRFDERMVRRARWVRVLLVPHAGAYLRLSRWASRRRQRWADAQIAAAGDGSLLDDALRVATLAPLAWENYWHRDVVAVLDAGHRPPLLEGFIATLQAAEVRRELALVWRAILEIEREHPYAAEPLPSSRLAASADRAQWPGLTGDPASGLLQQIDELERRVLAAYAGDAADALLPVAWEDVAHRVYADRWASTAIAGTAADLPALALDPDAAIAALGAAFAGALQRSGWHISLLPAHEPVARRGDGVELQPWVIAEELSHGGAASVRWLQQFAALGISDLPLDGSQTSSAAPLASPTPTSTVRGRLALPATKRTRVLHAIGMLILGTLAMPLGVASIAAGALADIPTGGRVFMLALGAASVAAFAFVAWKRTRLLYGTAELSVDGDTLTITHPLLRKPLVVTRGGVRAVVVDAGSTSASDPAMNRRFPIRGGSWAVAADPDAPVDWLWHDGQSMLPRLDVADQPPNVAIVLDPTILTPPLRHGPDHAPLRGEALAGVLLTADDPAAANALFAAWGVLRPLDLDDADYIERRVSGEEHPQTVALR